MQSKVNLFIMAQEQQLMERVHGVLIMTLPEII